MKKISLIFLLSLVFSCQGIAPHLPPQINQDSSAGFLTGVLSQKAINKIKKTLPKYEKHLFLESFEVCYLGEDHLVKCRLVSCTEGDCEKVHTAGLMAFIDNHKHNTYFIKKDAFQKFLASIENFCTDKKPIACEIIRKDYEDIKKLFIYEEEK